MWIFAFVHLGRTAWHFSGIISGHMCVIWVRVCVCGWWDDGTQKTKSYENKQNRKRNTDSSLVAFRFILKIQATLFDAPHLSLHTRPEWAGDRVRWRQQREWRESGENRVEWKETHAGNEKEEERTVERRRKSRRGRKREREPPWTEGDGDNEWNESEFSVSLLSLLPYKDRAQFEMWRTNVRMRRPGRIIDCYFFPSFFVNRKSDGTM